MQFRDEWLAKEFSKDEVAEAIEDCLQARGEDLPSVHAREGTYRHHRYEMAKRRNPVDVALEQQLDYYRGWAPDYDADWCADEG